MIGFLQSLSKPFSPAYQQMEKFKFEKRTMDGFTHTDGSSASCATIKRREC
jgi:hypothetical protein